MQDQDCGKRAPRVAALVLATAVATCCGALTGYAASQLSVSQKGRNFTPADVKIERGASLLIVNDDADLRHHAYVDSDKFSFDSGDQEPGSRTNVAFPVAGTFEVLCAIHPKMRLVVHVN